MAIHLLACLLILLALSPPAFAEETPVDVLIVGAGLAGLSTAYRLQKAGLTYKVIELSPHVGGRIRTASYPEKLSAEVGLEEFWVGNPTIEIMEALDVPREKSATSFSSFVYEGKLYPFKQDTNAQFLEATFSAADLKKYRAWDKKMIEMFQQTKVRPLSKELLKLKEISFGEWVRKKSGMPKKLQEFVRIESEPEYATSWDSISALDGILEWHIFAGEGTNSWHVVGGNQKLTDAIAKKIGMSNIVLNTKVTRIESGDDLAIVNGVDQGSFEQRVYKARYVVTTAPLFRLLEMQFLPSLTDARKDAIRSQTWGSYFTAHVVVSAAAGKLMDPKGEDLLPILSDGPLGVIYGEKGAADPNHPLMLLNLLVCGGDAERFNLRAATAMDSVREELTQAFDKRWPGFSKLIQKFEFYQYHPRAIASWPVGRSRLDEASELFRVPQGRVYFAGDYTEGTHSDGAAISAIRVVEQITARKKTEK